MILKKLIATLIFICPFLLCGAFYAPLLLSEFEWDKNSQEWLVSEKLDGVRGIWDGKKMYFRSGKEMNLPPAFTKDFPPFALDGEIYSPHKDFSQILSILKNQERFDEIVQLQYFVFDVPFAKGGLQERLESLKNYLAHTAQDFIVIIPQESLSSKDSIKKKLQQITRNGGEGIVLRNPYATYESGRSKNAFKLKITQDAECTIKDYTQGKGRYEGMVGALVCQYEDKIFKIGSGLNLAQRQNPPPIGSLITFKYYGLTHKGIPRFPVFWRLKESE